jgi:hypothetical protein
MDHAGLKHEIPQKINGVVADPTPATPGIAESPTAAATALSLEEQWAARIRLHLEAGVRGYIAGGLELIQAKRDLKKQRGSFIHMVEAELGENIDAVEKWMAIARNPFLADSANLRNLPTAWTTLYVLSPLKPSILAELVETGRLNPALTGAAATALVRTVRGRNDHRCRDDDRDDRRVDDRDGGTDQDDGHGADRGGGEHADGDVNGDGDAKADAGDGADQEAENSPPAQSASRDGTIGPNGPEEIARKLARLEELERETRRQAIQLCGYQSEVEEMRAKLGPDTPIRPQQRLFRQAIRALQKAETAGTMEKERQSLKEHAALDLVELVRSAIRDGLNPDRLDLVYRPELH